MVQYLPKQCYYETVKWTTRFIRFTGWIPLKYGSTTTPPIIAPYIRDKTVDFGEVVLETVILAKHIKVEHKFWLISGMVGLIDVKQKGKASVAVFMKIVGHVGHFRWLEPIVRWEIS